MEHDHAALVTIQIGSSSVFPRSAGESPDETIARALSERLEDQQILAIGGMISDCFVAASEFHITTARREARERLLDAARRREIDLVLVWRLDRWGRSVTDLTLQELEHQRWRLPWGVAGGVPNIATMPGLP